MLYTEEMVRMNIRNREGKRVFYLGKGDTLTPGARDWLNRERISVLPALSTGFTEKLSAFFNGEEMKTTAIPIK